MMLIAIDHGNKQSENRHTRHFLPAYVKVTPNRLRGKYSALQREVLHTFRPANPIYAGQNHRRTVLYFDAVRHRL